METAAGPKVQISGGTCYFTYIYNNKLDILFSLSKHEEEKRKEVQADKHSIQNVNKV
jgi:hypothetical protein